MEKVTSGKYVRVEYKGTLDDGRVFDTNIGKSPMEVEMGSGRLIKGFEEALMGMTLNEKKTFTLQPQEAYGERDENLKTSFSKKDIPEGMEPKVGEVVELSNPQGQQVPGWISEVDEENIVIDLNHPLAGQSLTFEVEVVGINNEPAEANQKCTPGDCSADCC